MTWPSWGVYSHIVLLSSSKAPMWDYNRKLTLSWLQITDVWEVKSFFWQQGTDLCKQKYTWTAMEHVEATVSPCPTITTTQLIFHGKWHKRKVLHNVSHILSIVKILKQIFCISDILSFLNNENTARYKTKITVTWLHLFSPFFKLFCITFCNSAKSNT